MLAPVPALPVVIGGPEAQSLVTLRAAPAEFRVRLLTPVPVRPPFCLPQQNRCGRVSAKGTTPCIIADAGCGRLWRPSTQPAEYGWSREREVADRRKQNLETR
jgi:hypothetical protein